MRYGRGLWLKQHSFLELCCLYGLGLNGVEGEKLHSGLVDTNGLHLNLLSCPGAKKRCLHMMQLLSCGNCTPVWSRSKFCPRPSNLKVMFMSMLLQCQLFQFVHCLPTLCCALCCVNVPFGCCGYDLVWVLGVWGIRTFTVHAEFIPPSPLTYLLIMTAPGLLTL